MSTRQVSGGNVFHDAARRMPGDPPARVYGLRPPTSPAGVSSPADTNSTTPVAPYMPPGGAPVPPAGQVRDQAQLDGPAAARVELTRASRRTWQSLPEADAIAAVDAGMLAQAQAAGRDMAAAVGDAAATMQRQGLPPDWSAQLDWRGFGTVIPVVAGSPGAGASVLAVLLSDALQLAGRYTLLIDAADPARSGLTTAAHNDGAHITQPHGRVGIRYSWRAQALLARMDTDLPIVAPGMVPPPRFWWPSARAPHATVVDIGQDSWRVAAHPLTGAGAWLRRGAPMPYPVLVVRPSRPSLLHAEQVLARLEPWITSGTATAPAQLVVMGAKRWPAGVAGAAGRRTSPLLERAVFIPHDAQLAAAGITSAVTPVRLRKAVLPVLRACGLLTESKSNKEGRRS